MTTLGKYKPTKAALNFANKIVEMFVGDEEYIRMYVGAPEYIEQKRLAVAFAFDVALEVAKGE